MLAVGLFGPVLSDLVSFLRLVFCPLLALVAVYAEITMLDITTRTPSADIILSGVTSIHIPLFMIYFRLNYPPALPWRNSLPHQTYHIRSTVRFSLPTGHRELPWLGELIL